MTSRDRSPFRLVVALLPALGLVLAGCTHSSATSGPSSPPSVSSSAAPSYTPAAEADVPALLPQQSLPAGEVDKLCPYVATGIQQQPTTATNVADIVGVRLYRTAVLTTTTPVGCRFWFDSSVAGENLPPYTAAADIVPTTFASRTAAYDALIATARAADPQARSQADIAPGVYTAVFRTAFVAADDGQDWACGFVAGDVMVIVRTAWKLNADQAVNLAQAVVSRF